ncbi:MAG: diguanylate cyclase [Chloroflexia bacterium]
MGALRRRAYIVALGLGTVAALWAWVRHGQAGHRDMFDQWVLPALAAWFAGTAAWIWCRPEARRPIEIATLAVLCAFFLAKLYRVTFGGLVGVVDETVELTVWVAVVYLFAFVGFGARWGRWISMGFFLLNLVLGLAYGLHGLRTGRSPVALYPLSQFYLSGGALIALLSVFAHLQESYLQTRALVEVESLLVDHMPLGGIVTDREHTILRWNAWMEAHSGIPAHQAVGRSLFELYPELEQRGIVAQYRRVLETGEVVVWSQRFHRYLLPMSPALPGAPFEQMQQSARIVPLFREGQVVGVVTLIEDVTERVWREAELKAQIEELDAANARLRETQAELERSNAELAAFNSLAAMLSLSLELSEVLEVALDNCLSFLGFEVGAIYLVERGENRLVLAAHRGLPEEVVRLRQVLLLEGGSGEGWLSPKGMERPHFGAERFWGEQFVVCARVPLWAKGVPVGLLILGAARERELSASERNLIIAFGHQISIAVDNARLHQEIRERAMRDSLTGLYNHAHLRERLREEVERARREGRTLALLMLDLDHFKQLNDTYGHLLGDAALRSVAQVLRRQTREYDVAGRYGGEEFVVVLPGAGEDEAREVAERIRTGVKEAPSPGLEGVPITVSIGVALFPTHGDSPDALIAAADTALYQAKALGRDRIVMATSG